MDTKRRTVPVKEAKARSKVPKSWGQNKEARISFRADPKLVQAFGAYCEAVDLRPSQAIRRALRLLMNEKALTD